MRSTIAILFVASFAACSSEVVVDPHGGGGSAAGGAGTNGGGDNGTGGEGGTHALPSGGGGADLGPCPTDMLVGPDGFACSATIDAPCAMCPNPSCVDQGSEPVVAHEPSARCVLEALRDRTFGVVAVNVTPDASSLCGERDTIHITGDVAWVLHDVYVDRGHDETGAPRALRPPAFYQACLDGPSSGLAACLTDLFLEAPAACPADCCASQD